MPRKSIPATEQIAAAGGGKKRKYPVADVSKRTHKEIVYHSELEARVAAWLDMRLQGRKKCDECHGFGVLNSGIPDYEEYPCWNCKGKGYFGRDVLRWERQVKFQLWAACAVGGKTGLTLREIEPVGTYAVDFVVHFSDGHTEWWEVKSWWQGKVSKKTGKRGKGGAHITADARLKIAIFRANNPNKTFKIITGEDLPKGW